MKWIMNLLGIILILVLGFVLLQKIEGITSWLPDFATGVQSSIAKAQDGVDSAKNYVDKKLNPPTYYSGDFGNSSFA